MAEWDSKSNKRARKKQPKESNGYSTRKPFERSPAVAGYTSQWYTDLLTYKGAPANIPDDIDDVESCSDTEEYNSMRDLEKDLLRASGAFDHDEIDSSGDANTPPPPPDSFPLPD